MIKPRFIAPSNTRSRSLICAISHSFDCSHFASKIIRPQIEWRNADRCGRSELTGRLLSVKQNTNSAIWAGMVSVSNVWPTKRRGCRKTAELGPPLRSHWPHQREWSIDSTGFSLFWMIFWIFLFGLFFWRPNQCPTLKRRRDKSVHCCHGQKVERQQLNVSRGQVRHVPLFKNLVRIPYRVCHSHQTPSLDWQLTVSLHLGHKKKKIPTKNPHLPLEHFVSISQTRTLIASFWRGFFFQRNSAVRF